MRASNRLPFVCCTRIGISAHERLVGQIAREVGFREISVSHVVAPLPKFVARADTTVVDAYLNPVLRDYVERLRTALPGSIGANSHVGGRAGWCGAFLRQGQHSLRTGGRRRRVLARGAGGRIFAGDRLRHGRHEHRCSRFDGRFDLEYETEKAGVRLVAPTMAIETVAAGGGSICRFDGVKLDGRAGERGADPGPACYGRGGPLTVTDVNLFLGRIVAERFPFPLDLASDGAAAEAAGRGSCQFVRRRNIR